MARGLIDADVMAYDSYRFSPCVAPSCVSGTTVPVVVGRRTSLLRHRRGASQRPGGSCSGEMDADKKPAGSSAAITRLHRFGVIAHV